MRSTWYWVKHSAHRRTEARPTEEPESTETSPGEAPDGSTDCAIAGAALGLHLRSTFLGRSQRQIFWGQSSRHVAS
jgi:hypothetical protein